MPFSLCLLPLPGPGPLCPVKDYGEEALLGAVCGQLCPQWLMQAPPCRSGSSSWVLRPRGSQCSWLCPPSTASCWITMTHTSPSRMSATLCVPCARIASGRAGPTSAWGSSQCVCVCVMYLPCAHLTPLSTKGGSLNEDEPGGPSALCPLDMCHLPLPSAVIVPSLLDEGSSHWPPVSLPFSGIRCAVS